MANKHKTYFLGEIISETGWICIAIVSYNWIWWHYNQNNNESNKQEIEKLKDRLTKIERSINEWNQLKTVEVKSSK